VFEQFGAGGVRRSGQHGSLLRRQFARQAKPSKRRGEGRVLVVDGGGSRRRALLGGNLGARPCATGGRGHDHPLAACADSREFDDMSLGIRALGAIPLRSDKRGEGELDVPVRFAGVTFRPGDHVYADEDGVVVSATPLS
jgi:regulator of ribonuclease activity A